MASKIVTLVRGIVDLWNQQAVGGTGQGGILRLSPVLPGVACAGGIYFGEG